MTLAYLVTEGKSDVEILKKLLPEQIVRDTQLVVAGSRYSAQSLAGTILAVKLLPVALVIDADTEDEVAIREKTELLHYLLRQASPGIPFEVFTAVPELEAVFLHDRFVLEKITEIRLNDLEWQVAKHHPKEFLIENLGQEPLFFEKILRNLDDEMIHILQQHPLIKGITEFLGSIVPLASSL